jgi:hypothetical protein
VSDGFNVLRGVKHPYHMAINIDDFRPEAIRVAPVARNVRSSWGCPIILSNVDL